MSGERTQFEMSEDDLKTILNACKPVRVMMLQCGSPTSPQENANRAWQELGLRLGFVWDTVRPVQGAGQRTFTAVPLPEAN